MICHISIEIIFIIFDVVDIYPGNTAVTEEFFLIIHMMLMKQCNRVSCTDRFLADRQAGICDPVHLFSDPIQKSLIQTRESVYCEIISRSDRIMDFHLLHSFLTCHIINRLKEHQAGTSFVGGKSYMVSDRHKLHSTVTLYLLVKLPESSVCHDQYDRKLCIFLIFIDNIPVGSPTGIFFCFTIDSYFCHFLFHNKPSRLPLMSQCHIRAFYFCT